MSREKQPADGKVPGWQAEIYQELRLLAVVLAVVILLFHFFAQLIVVVGDSMYPTLHNGDLMIAWRFQYTPEAGDIVVVHKETPTIQQTIVKRVIATGGQTVELDYEENAVYVDGVRLEEDYINLEETDPMLPVGDVTSIDVPEDCLFVMGDNRNHSTDSRFTYDLGLVEEGYVVGEAVCVFFPFQHLQWLDS
ncbi:MAG TPA: signal peptidase I [Candidatus Onthomonas avicola]|nr:signal peptidase I [Candidatus Onthomonas avicola]